MSFGTHPNFASSRPSRFLRKSEAQKTHIKLRRKETCALNLLVRAAHTEYRPFLYVRALFIWISPSLLFQGTVINATISESELNTYG